MGGEGLFTFTTGPSWQTKKPRKYQILNKPISANHRNRIERPVLIITPLT